MAREILKRQKRDLDWIIGHNIQDLRIEHNLTREALAEMIELVPSHIGLLERGERGATPVTLVKLSKAFNKPIDYFFHPRKEK